LVGRILLSMALGQSEGQDTHIRVGRGRLALLLIRAELQDAGTMAETDILPLSKAGLAGSSEHELCS